MSDFVTHYGAHSLNHVWELWAQRELWELVSESNGLWSNTHMLDSC